MEERVSCKLGDLFDFEYGKGLPKKQRNETGSYPMSCTASNGIVGFHDEYLVEGPAIIVGRKGAAGEVAFEKKNLWPIDTTYFVKVPQCLDFMFSFFLLKSLVLSQLDKSTAIPGLNRNDAYNLNINLPTTSRTTRHSLQNRAALQRTGQRHCQPQTGTGTAQSLPAGGAEESI